MTTQQGLRHASFRAIGSGTGTYQGDARAAFEAEATVQATDTFEGAMVAWLQARLSSSNGNLHDLKQEFAAANGAFDWDSLGTFPPA